MVDRTNRVKMHKKKVYTESWKEKEKRMKRKVLALALAAIMVVPSISGCGGSTSESGI